MVQLISGKNGEVLVQLVIDLNINLNDLSGKSNISISKEQITDKNEEEPKWEVPTFTSAPKIKFGKPGEQ